MFTFTGLLPRIRSPLLFPATGDSIAQGATTTFRWRLAASQAEDPHYYQLHIFGPGVDTLLKTNDTSLAVPALSNFQKGVSYRWHVWIKDENTSVSSQDTFQFIYGSTHLDTLKHLNVKPGGGYSALWGYTAPNGREYALLGCNGSGGQQAGTSIIDITDSNNVHQVAFVLGPASSWREMKTYRQYAYIVSEAGTGTQIVDLSTLPDSVHLVRTFTYTSGAKNTAKAHSISIHDGFMYLNGCANWGTQFQRGIVIFDLRTDPTNPVFAGEYSPDYIHDCYVLRDTIYGAAIYNGGGVYIADARNKSNITQIGKITYAGSGTHNSWVTKDRHYLITTDEIGTTAKTLKMWDISNLPTIPSIATATYTVAPTDIEHNITIRGDYAYVAWYTRGAVVVNIANPANPTTAGGYDTSTQPPGSYNGMWGIYPFFPSGKIVGGDMQNGLWVFKFSDLPSRQPVTLIEPVDGDTVAQAEITFRWTKSADLEKDPHYYQVRLWGLGVDTTWQSNDNVTSFTNFVALHAGQQYTWYVITRDEWNTTYSPDSSRFIYTPLTDVQEPASVPYTYRVNQNYPNPFNPSTRISYELAAKSHVILRVFNILGEQVAELVNNTLPAGRYDVVFDAKGLSSGIYFYRLDAGEFMSTKKMILLR